MSWNAYFRRPTCEHCGVQPEASDWNYTFNVTPMVTAALDEVDSPTPSYWKQLNGMTGAEGAVFLSTIVERLEADPPRFRKMNPANNWGDYDGLLAVLREMRDESKAYPNARWTTTG